MEKPNIDPELKKLFEAKVSNSMMTKVARKNSNLNYSLSLHDIIHELLGFDVDVNLDVLNKYTPKKLVPITRTAPVTQHKYRSARVTNEESSMSSVKNNDLKPASEYPGLWVAYSQDDLQELVFASGESAEEVHKKILSIEGQNLCVVYIPNSV